ncbi:MAG: hypothetical protein PHU80_11140 [Kiritimatiellae bacterium]|nr:hypothetical protein [Kiritimatiellia bacterium]
MKNDKAKAVRIIENTECCKKDEAPGLGEKAGVALDHAAAKTTGVAKRTAASVKHAIGWAVERAGSVMEKAGSATETAGRKCKK